MNLKPYAREVTVRAVHAQSPGKPTPQKKGTAIVDHNAIAPIESRRRVIPPYKRTLPPRSMVGHLPLEQVIGVRIPGGQPDSIQYSCMFPNFLCPSCVRKSQAVL